MRSPYRLHERSSFYKYMPLSTAEIVLQNASLRWSSPLIFNDPFDVPREVIPDVNEHDISRALAKKILLELKNPRPDTSQLNSGIRYLLEFYKNYFPFGLPEELIKKQTELILNPPVGEGAKDALTGFRNYWDNTLRDRRILCLSESPVITSMWNHYADSYKGIVLEFSCLDELDSAWLLAKPVKYTDEKPLTYTAEGMAELFFMDEEIVKNYINEDITYIKTLDWQYEKEWRVSTHKRPLQEGLYSDLTFNIHELKTIILGPMFDMDKLPAINELSEKYPLASVSSATITRSGLIEIIPLTTN
ncbi:DUF2971 domain-containing protein [Enterobacter hormaechei]|uniref:DUF2971 domain-containing protein n=1 Tax=Enterobacter hormaechei TaxID=158836 RepID=UPI0014632501|nr:DUF2971 domain-containing protein [Enterobacter hormaechei]ELC6358886.1 DUF2971 domain-containing protein [Enterobacter hormaechei]QJQ17452.1 DUF2971 domain-containing protein [Enterobacter hormaechei]UXI43196.1 DUF2971 domain-containing protein [Enterobacter hormaechei]HCU0596741.1 DUF2971 domain-containing protein [Enterobacter hormaechei]